MGRILGKAAEQAHARAQAILQHEPVVSHQEEVDQLEDIGKPKVKCDQCSFVAKNENGLRLHMVKHGRTE